MKPFLGSLLKLWQELGLNQRVSLGLASLAVVGVMLAMVFWARRPDYQLLYGRLGEKDTAAIVSSLQSQGIAYKTEGNGTIYVPRGDVHRLRMDLAGRGLPSGDGVGFEIFDKGQFGLSDFVQRTNYNRAIQGELARTISQLDGVSHARVMIVQPESRLLLTEQGVKPTASVFVELTGGRLEVEGVNSIRQLVANAVQGLETDDVAVVDQKGRVLSAGLEQDPGLSNASSQIRYRQQVEDYFARKVETMLLPVVGPGNAVVRVSAEINTEAATMVEERFDPESAVIRSQTSTEDSTTSVEGTRRAGAAGIAGNSPDSGEAERTTAAGPASQNEQNRKNRTTSYEINRTLTNTTRTAGTVERLSASVFVAPRTAADGTVAPRTADEIRDLQRIVINALGLRVESNTNLDDLVTLRETTFHTPETDEVVTRIERETRIQGWLEAGSRYGTVAVALGALFIFFRLLRKQAPEAVPVELLNVRTATDQAGSRGGALTPEMLNEMIRQRPDNIGHALKNWVGANRN